MASAERSRRPGVYILRCRDGSFYTGAATDLPRRLAKHDTGRASRYTRARLPVTLVWSRRVRSWSDALRLEHRIKPLRRLEKTALVRGVGRLPRRPRRARRGRVRGPRAGMAPGGESLPPDSLVFSFASLSRMKARMSSAMARSLVHCSL